MAVLPPIPKGPGHPFHRPTILSNARPAPASKPSSKKLGGKAAATKDR